MAVGRANCTCKTCGATFEMRGNRRNRKEAESWVRWAEGYYDECSACYTARVEEEKMAKLAEAKEAAAESGLPELIGTPKQIEWAITLRFKCLDFLAKCQVDPRFNTEVVNTIISMVSGKQKASWWIDNHQSFEEECGLRQYVRNNAEKIKAAMEAPSEDAAAKESAMVIVEPSEKAHGGVVEIAAAENRVSARYEKDDDFRELVKNLGYRWSLEGREWYKDINYKTGTAAERAAELGNKLLNAGFSVSIADEDVRNAAIEGKYEPQTYRWIASVVSGKYAGMLKISWDRADDFERKAIAIPGARHDKYDVVVPIDRWQEVEDFASMHDFKFSPGAKKAIEQKKASTITVAPAAPKEATYVEHDPADIMQSSNDVLGDLVDD